MLDRLEEFRKVIINSNTNFLILAQNASKEGVSLTLNSSLLDDEEENKSKDRALIIDFITMAKESIKTLGRMEESNNTMKGIVDKSNSESTSEK